MDMTVNAAKFCPNAKMPARGRANSNHPRCWTCVGEDKRMIIRGSFFWRGVRGQFTP